MSVSLFSKFLTLGLELEILALQITQNEIRVQLEKLVSIIIDRLLVLSLISWIVSINIIYFIFVTNYLVWCATVSGVHSLFIGVASLLPIFSVTITVVRFDMVQSSLKSVLRQRQLYPMLVYFN